ncbi:MAG TPA: hypothetical protein VH186_21505 [Chloroflexia bacterium]|nr:hypothetical protein [Chloroflexia bacterium]
MNQNEQIFLRLTLQEKRRQADKERLVKEARTSKPVRTGMSLKQQLGRQLLAWGRRLATEA